MADSPTPSDFRSALAHFEKELSVLTMHEELTKRAKKKVSEEVNATLSPVLKVLFAESDRGAIMVAQSALDNLLYELFTAIFNRGCPSLKAKELAWLLKGTLAPLGNFARRVKTAEALGLISRDLAKLLLDINDLRVNPAHGEQEFLMDSKLVAKLVANLDEKYAGGATVLKGMLHPADELRRERYSEETRLALASCLFIAFYDLKHLGKIVLLLGWPPHPSEEGCQRMAEYLGDIPSNPPGADTATDSPRG